jgi:hypothetical protein
MITFSAAIKEGLSVVHRNWQLVIIQLAMVMVNFISFFIIVGIPLAVAFIIFGIDLTGIADIKDIFRTLRGPSEILSRYFGLLLLVMLSFLLYIIAAALFGIYVFGGAAGVIGQAIINRTAKFSLHSFFHEAKKLFVPILGFTTVIGLVLIIAAFLLGILGGSIAALISFARGQDSTLALFFGTFLSLILTLIALALIVSTLSVTLYGIATLFFKETGPVKSLKATTLYLFRHPDALWLYGILFVGYIIASFFLISISYAFKLIPVIGTFIAFPYQFVSYVVQSYLGLAIISIAFTFYHSTEVPQEQPPAPEDPAEQKEPAPSTGEIDAQANTKTQDT